MMPSAIFPDLAGKPVLITGGGTGIGAALSEGFARQGARVAFIDIAEEASRALAQRIADAAAWLAAVVPALRTGRLGHLFLSGNHQFPLEDSGTFRIRYKTKSRSASTTRY